MLIRGGCHFGNLRFELDWEGEPTGIPARACGCSFCVKHGGTWTSNPDAVNVNTFENVPAALLSRAPASFESEDVEGRLARRTRNWIGDVRFVTPALAKMKR